MLGLKLASILGFSLTAAWSTPSFASTIECSDPHAYARYSYFAPDGGPQRNKEISWVIDGKRYIEETQLEIVRPGGDGFERPVKTIETELADQVTLSVSQIPDFEITTFVALAKVSEIKTSNLLFSGLVICSYSRYSGVPRP